MSYSDTEEGINTFNIQSQSSRICFTISLLLIIQVIKQVYYVVVFEFNYFCRAL